MSLETIDFDRLRLVDNDRILDLGCGEGRHAITAYLEKQVDSVGIDLSLDDLNTTSERFSEFQQDDDNRSLCLSVASGLTLPFADNTFDKVICSEVLEHVPDYRQVLNEIQRVLKPGGVFGVSVPRFFPEWVCWRLSDGYHEVPGGHIRIFNASHLNDDVSSRGFVRYDRHHAHSLHVPYWWLKCMFWREDNNNTNDGDRQAWIVRTYHRFLVWDLMKRPRLTYWMDRLLNPLMGKSVVMYYVKQNTRSSAA